MNNGIIYMYTSPSGKSYIGQTWNEKLRKWNHKTGKGSSRYLSNAIKKYGFNNFKYEILHREITDQDRLNLLEYNEIKNRNTIYPHGYNLKEGGGSRGKMSEESINKMRESQKNRPPMSMESRLKISKANKGVKKTKEHILKVVQSRKSFKWTNEQKNNAKNCHKRNEILCIETNVKYASIRDASRDIGISSGCISLAVNGKRITAGGFHWILVNNISNDEINKIITKKTKNDLIRMQVVCIETGAEYNSVSEAKKITGIHNISRACKNKNYKAGGFHWRYKN